jgi:zinc protease
VVQDRVPQARIYKVWNIPEYGNADSVYLDLVSDVLSSGKSSRFYKRLVYDDQIATDANAYVDPKEIAGQFGVQATAKPGQGLAQVEKELDEELARFLKDGPTAEELQRVKAQYEAHFIRGVERIGGFGGKSDRLAESEVFLGSPDGYKTSLKLAREATAEDLKAAATRWLSDGVYILQVQPFPDYKAASAGSDRSKAPVPGTPPELKLPKLQRAKLSNGLNLILAERHEVPLVNLWMVSDAGYAADQSASPGTASMTMALLTGGTKTRNALEISDQLALLGAQLQANSNLDLSTVKLSALKSKLDSSLELFADVILNPSFPETDFKRQQKLQLAGIEREKNTPVQMALRVFPGLLYGPNHAYGNPLTGSGTSASVSKMTREDLLKFHDVWMRPNDSTLVVVGDTTLAEVTPKLEKLFAGWKAEKVPTKNIRTVQAPSKSAVYLIDKPGALQSIIIAGEIAPPTNNPKEVAIDAMNDGLGGMFGSRLNMNLREDKHWSYGVRSRLSPARGERPYYSVSPVQTDKTKESLAELVAEYKNIVSGKPISEAELKDEQSNATLGLPGTFETVQQLSGAYSTILQYNLAEDYYNTYTQRVLAVTPDKANEIAKKYIQPSHLVWVVVGDMSKVEAGVRELNVGEVHKIDADGNPVQ